MGKVVKPSTLHVQVSEFSTQHHNPPNHLDFPNKHSDSGYRSPRLATSDPI